LIIMNQCPLASHQDEIWTRFAADTTAAKPSPGTLPSATITASTGPCPTPNTTDASTIHCPQEEPQCARHDTLTPSDTSPESREAPADEPQEHGLDSGRRFPDGFQRFLR